MNFVSIRLITDNIKPLVRFYEDVTGVAPTWYTDDFAEFATSSCTLAVGSTRTLQFFGSNVATPASNRSAIIEFRVDDVDDIYSQITGSIREALVQEPTTMPWGNRSLLFRDPDGNLVNFFTPVTEQALGKLDG